VALKGRYSSTVANVLFILPQPNFSPKTFVTECYTAQQRGDWLSKKEQDLGILIKFS